MNRKQVVLITGASSGIGRATAAMLAERNHRVFGTSRDPGRVSPIPGVEFLPLDLADEASIRGCVERVLEAAGGLHVLINNAGALMVGSAERSGMDEMRSLFNVDFWGPVWMMKAVLPAMRAQRSGRIVNVSGLAGRIGVPCLGAYCAAKHALEGFSEALDHEIRDEGIRVSLLEPGFVNTAFGTPLLEEASSSQAEEDAERFRFLNLLQREAERGLAPERVAAAILKILGSKHPKVRNPVGPEAAFLLAARRWMPSSLFERRLRQAFGQAPTRLAQDR